MQPGSEIKRSKFAQLADVLVCTSIKFGEELNAAARTSAEFAQTEADLHDTEADLKQARIMICEQQGSLIDKQDEVEEMERQRDARDYDICKLKEAAGGKKEFADNLADMAAERANFITFALGQLQLAEDRAAISSVMRKLRMNPLKGVQLPEGFEDVQGPLA